MRFTINFSQEETERLYITYKKNLPNYEQIKDRLMGVGSDLQFKKEIRGRLVFLANLTFIIVVSSLFTWMMDRLDVVASLWGIWGITSIIFSIWLYMSYRQSYTVLQKNEAFFKDFEAKASKAATLKDFKELS